MPDCSRIPTQCAALGLIATLVVAGIAVAGDDRRAARVPLLPLYQQECAACHVAYPPGLLPPGSWQRILSDLPRHYGTDASLDPAQTKELSAWLVSNAGTHKRVREDPAGDRITRSSWFIRKHDEVPTTAWKLPAVKSAANCGACHIRSEQGDFSERDVRIPR